MECWGNKPCVSTASNNVVFTNAIAIFFKGTDGTQNSTYLSSLFIQISLLRRNNHVFAPSVICKPLYFMSRYTINRFLSRLHAFTDMKTPHEKIFLPTRHQCLSILLYVARKTSHCGRTMPPSFIKWWSCIFRERVWPLKSNGQPWMRPSYPTFS